MLRPDQPLPGTVTVRAAVFVFIDVTLCDAVARLFVSYHVVSPSRVFFFLYVRFPHGHRRGRAGALHPS